MDGLLNQAVAVTAGRRIFSFDAAGQAFQHRLGVIQFPAYPAQSGNSSKPSQQLQPVDRLIEKVVGPRRDALHPLLA